MNFESVKEKFLNGEMIKRKGGSFIYLYQGIKKNRKTNQEFHSVILVDEEKNFKGYAKIGFNDVLADDWEVLQVKVAQDVEETKETEEIEEMMDEESGNLFGNLDF